MERSILAVFESAIMCACVETCSLKHSPNMQWIKRTKNYLSRLFLCKEIKFYKRLIEDLDIRGQKNGDPSRRLASESLI